MTIDSAKEKIKALLEKRGFVVQSMKEGLFIIDTGASKVGVELFGDRPVVGVFINNKLEEEGHGVEAVFSLRSQVLAVWDREINRGVSEQPAPKPEPKDWKCPVCGKGSVDGIAVEHEAGCDYCAKRLKAQPAKEKPKGDEKMEETKEKGLVPQEKAKPLVKLSDHELEEKIERAKARRFTSGQGDFYKVQGKERPDAAMVQKLANESGISVEITKAEQTDKYAHVEVVGIFGNLRVPAVVHHDFDTEFMLKTMEIIEKNPEILDHYEGTVPVIKEGAKIETGFGDKKKMVDAKYYLIHTLLSFKKFSLRDALTKSMSIAQLKLLNQEFRDEAEIESEESEKDLVTKMKSKV